MIMSRKITIGIFLFVLGAGFLTNLFLLGSGRIPRAKGAGEMERALETASPLSIICRRFCAALPGENREVVRGRRGVRFWRPELTALSRPPRLGAAGGAIRDFAAMFPKSTRKIILLVPPKSRWMKDFLPFPLAVPAPGAALSGETELPVSTLDEEFRHLSETGIPAFLRNDHHWSPDGMSAAVDRAAEMLGLEKRGEAGELRLKMTAAGDLGGMTGAPPESVMIFVPNPAGEAEADPDIPEVLICGDSFMNIYSQASLGWGSGAGFPDLLASRYRCRVTCLAVNGGGEGASRRQLAASGIDLSAFDCVIWEFPEYELCRSDWLPTPVPADHDNLRLPGGTILTGTILAAPAPPSRESASRLYGDALGEYILSGDNGEEFLMLTPVRLDGEVLPMPPVGARVLIRALEWRSAAAVYGGMARLDTEDGRSLRLPVIFGADVQILPPEPRETP